MAYPPSTLAVDKTDATAVVIDHPAHHNALGNAINDIVTELGTNPSGSSADVGARFDALLTGVAGTGTGVTATATTIAWDVDSTVLRTSTVNTVTGAKTFDDAKLLLNGATSGTSTLKAAAVAGTTTLTLPGSTDTLVGLAATQTLTNKTLTSPTLTTPTLGVATATTVNKVALTAPATGSTLTIADGKTLTASNSLTLAGTDATTMTFPGSSDTVVGLAATQTLTGKTLTAPTLTGASTIGAARTLTGADYNADLYSDAAITFNSGATTIGPLLWTANTITLSVAGNTTNLNQSVIAGRTVKNDGVAAAFVLGGSRIFIDQSAMIADVKTGMGAGNYQSFRSAPTWSITNAATFTSGTYTGFVAVPAIGTGTTLSVATMFGGGSPSVVGTVTTFSWFKANNPTGGGTITSLYGVDIPALTAGGTNVGIRNLSAFHQVGLASFGSDTAPTYGIHMLATTGDAGSMHLAEVTTTPTNPASSAGVVVYTKADKFVIAFNHAGTMRYVTYDLTQSSTAVWATSTTAP